MVSGAQRPSERRLRAEDQGRKAMIASHILDFPPGVEDLMTTA